MKLPCSPSRCRDTSSLTAHEKSFFLSFFLVGGGGGVHCGDKCKEKQNERPVLKTIENAEMAVLHRLRREVHTNVE